MLKHLFSLDSGHLQGLEMIFGAYHSQKWVSEKIKTDLWLSLLGTFIEYNKVYLMSSIWMAA